MKVLVLGSGGREHALAKKLAESRRVSRVFVCPGNAGIPETAGSGKIQRKGLFNSFSMSPPFAELTTWAKAEDIKLVVIGPEDYLSLGMADAFRQAGIPVFGHSQAATQLESSKLFAKKLMKKIGIPTAKYKEINSFEEGMKCIGEFSYSYGYPLVLKADGLCAGKGVILAHTPSEAEAALQVYYKEKRFGKAGQTVLVEEFLEGREVSVMALTDGTCLKLLPASEDHKRLLDDDRGPNTGGMGVYTPVAFLSDEDLVHLEKNVLMPVISEMQKMGLTLCGLLYAGFMKTSGGYKVLEFNVRFGDPETQCVLPLFEEDLFECMLLATRGELASLALKPNLAKENSSSLAAVTVVLASQGYPLNPITNRVILGVENVQDSEVFHAATGLNKEAKFVSSGGRVLSLTAKGANLQEARERVYADVKKIQFEGMQYRSDIALKGIET